MSEHETSLNPFHIFDNEDQEGHDDLYNSGVFHDARVQDSGRKFGNLEKRKMAGGSHRTVDHSGTILIDEINLEPVHE